MWARLGNSHDDLKMIYRLQISRVVPAEVAAAGADVHGPQYRHEGVNEWL
jgi:hypothetical protein